MLGGQATAPGRLLQLPAVHVDLDRWGADARMMERHNAHLAPSYVAAVPASFPELGIKELHDAC